MPSIITNIITIRYHYQIDFGNPAEVEYFTCRFCHFLGNNKYEKMVTKRKTFICYSGYKCAVTIMCHFFSSSLQNNLLKLIYNSLIKVAKF